MDMPNSQQSPTPARALTGSWKIGAGGALSLRPVRTSVLRIARGQAWITLGSAPRGHGNESGDHFLGAGQELRVPAGRHLVLESMDAHPVHFDWLPAPAAPRMGAQWEQTVVQPVRDFGRALSLAGSALWRLLRGLLGYSQFLVAGRGRVLSDYERNPP